MAVFLRFSEYGIPQLNKIFADTAQHYGFYYLDILPFFSKFKDTKQFHILPWDQHPNEAAHRLYADILFDYLVEQNLLHIK